VASMMDSGAEGPGFKSQPLRCRVAVLGKLFTPTVPLFTKHKIGTIRYDTRCYFNVRSKADISQLNLPHESLIYRTVAALLRVAGVTAGLAESNGSLPPGL